MLWTRPITHRLAERLDRVHADLEKRTGSLRGSLSGTDADDSDPVATGEEDATDRSDWTETTASTTSSTIPLTTSTTVAARTDQDTRIDSGGETRYG